MAHLVRASLPATSRAELPELEPHSGHNETLLSLFPQDDKLQDIYVYIYIFIYSHTVSICSIIMFIISPHRSYVEGDRRSKVKGLPTLLKSKTTKD